jgi:hypothetical protein
MGSTSDCGAPGRHTDIDGDMVTFRWAAPHILSTGFFFGLNVPLRSADFSVMLLPLRPCGGKDGLNPDPSHTFSRREKQMATKAKKLASAPPRQPERKWGPFHGGLGLAVWLNEVETAEGTRYFRSITIAPRRYRDAKSGQWKDAGSLRPSDIPTLMLALQAAHDYIHATPLPGQSIEPEEVEESNFYGSSDGAP